MSIRPSKRLPHQLRSITITRAYTTYAEGSVLIAYGNTRVLCNASILEKTPAFQGEKKHGWITAEYSMLPRATLTRHAREALTGRQTGRSQEIQRLIGRSLRNVVDLERLGPRTIHLDCDVLQADGGTRVAAITGSYCALVDAVEHLLKNEVLQQSPIRYPVAAVSVGIYQKTAIVDLDYAEDSCCDVDMNIVMNDRGQFIEIQASGEKDAITFAQLTTLLQLGQAGITELLKLTSPQK